MSQNLAVIPNSWGQYNVFGVVKYNGDPQIVHIDNSVVHEGNPSIRIDAHTPLDNNKYREVNGNFIPCKPGDHIIFKVWVKTGHSTLGQDGLFGNGGIIGFDYYSATGRLREHSSDDPRANTDPTFYTFQGDPQKYVPFNSDWTLRTLDCIVPDKVLDERTYQIAIEPITGIIAWLQGSGYIVPPNHAQDEGQVWFTDAELYINPSTPVSQQTLIIVPSTVGGTTDPAPGAYTVNAGSIFPVKNLPAAGYKFKTWMLDGADQDPWWHLAGTINITMSTDHAIQAVFEPVSQPAPPSQAGGGATAFLLVIGGVTVFGLALGLTSGRKRIQRRRRR